MNKKFKEVLEAFYSLQIAEGSLSRAILVKILKVLSGSALYDIRLESQIIP